MDIYEKCFKVKEASFDLALCSNDTRKKILCDFASKLRTSEKELISANIKDVHSAKENGLKNSFIERLTLSPERIEQMADGVEKVAFLDDPLGNVLEERMLDNGILLKKVSVPLGVIGIIFESRPNVSADSMALCLKSGNACVLRGGKEAISTNKVIAEIMKDTLRENGVNENSVYLIEDNTHASSEMMMKMNGIIDVLIPRGGKNLIKSVVENATVPVIETGAGNCHAYVDKDCDIELAVRVCLSAKVSRPSVCNSLEKILVHKDVAKEFLPLLASELAKSGVEMHCCEKACEIIGTKAKLAEEYDWYEEYNDLIVGIKVVESIEAAVKHIRKYSTNHSEVIFTNDIPIRDAFMAAVDSAAVYCNASTRFTDGGMFGMGAEIGISTQKLHARGPMGLKELTSYKYLLYGDGQTR